MIFKDKDLCMFAQLGMTKQQVKIYVTLSKLKHATVKSIAKAAQVNRAEVYRVIPKLEELGLVKRIISSPTTFWATPLPEGLSVLIERNAKKHREIEKAAQQFLQSFNRQEEKPSQKDYQYWLTKGLEAETRELSKELSETKTSSDGIINWRLLLDVVNRHFKNFKKTLKKGVKFRCITDAPEDTKIPQSIRALIDTGFFEVKFAHGIPKASIAIFDGERVQIITIPNADVKKIEVLRITNPAIVELSQHYFDVIWQGAITRS